MKETIYVLLMSVLISYGSIRVANAVEVNIQIDCNPPTQYEDGSALESTQIAHYNVIYSVEGETPMNGETTIPDCNNSFPLELPLDKEATVIVDLQTVLIDGRVSKLSGKSSTNFVVRDTRVPGVPTETQMIIRCGEGCEILLLQ